MWPLCKRVDGKKIVNWPSWPDSMRLNHRLICNRRSLQHNIFSIRHTAENREPASSSTTLPSSHISRTLFVWRKVIFRIISLRESYLVGDVAEVCVCVRPKTLSLHEIFGIICYLWYAHYYYHLVCTLSVCDCVIYMNINELTSWHKYGREVRVLQHGGGCSAAAPLQRSSSVHCVSILFSD